MRVRVPKEKLTLLFDELYKHNYSLSRLSKILDVHTRTISDWRRGKFTIPQNEIIVLARLANLRIEKLEVKELSDWWYTSNAGHLGGRAYIKRYKSLGTIETRTVGGNATYKKYGNTKNSIYARKLIKKPKESNKLAELIGILIGDGSINSYQVSVTLNITTDKEYAPYVIALMTSLFGLHPTSQRRERSGCIVIVVSSVELVDFLISKGLPKGNKLRAEIDVPQWIQSNKEYSQACIRGMFDTDGSIFQEVHKHANKSYSYPRMAFVSYSPGLRSTIVSLLRRMNVEARIRNERNVTIERFTDIKEYFRIVGSSNPKHLLHYARCGGVG